MYCPTKRCYELTRDEVFGAYRRTGRVVANDAVYNGGSVRFGDVTFVAKGWDQPEADWAWVPVKHGMTTLAYYEAGQRRDEAGKRLGEALLAIPTEALDAWAQARAANAPLDGNHRTLAHLNEDWPNLVDTFSLPSGEVPDNGSMRCLVHLMVDRALGLTSTSYCY